MRCLLRSLALLVTLVAEASAGDPRGCARADGRLEASDRVLGVIVAGEPRAYAIAELQSTGTALHDLVAGKRIDVGISGTTAAVLYSADPIHSEVTSWRSWTTAHPATSLWRQPAVAEPEVVRSPDEVRVSELRGYHTVIGCAMAQSRLTSPKMEADGLYVISGTIENTAPTPVHHVVLRYELVDAGGTVVYRDEGFNRSAEELASPPFVQPGKVLPIAAGASDTFRMIMLAEELPAFDKPKVSVARIY